MSDGGGGSPHCPLYAAKNCSLARGQMMWACTSTSYTWHYMIQLMPLYSPKITEYVPQQHLMQVSHQIAMTQANFCVYVCTSDTGIVFTVLLFCPSSTTAVPTMQPNIIAQNHVSWAYDPRSEVPHRSICEYKAADISLLRFWTMLNQHVVVEGESRPV